LPIIIRAVGQAGRRGATFRTPNAEALLEIVEAWLVEAAADTVRGHATGARTAEGEMLVSLHPASRPVIFSASDSGRLTVEAQTDPVGPGYHTFVASLLRRLGEELDIDWSPAEGDPAALPPDRPSLAGMTALPAPSAGDGGVATGVGVAAASAVLGVGKSVGRSVFSRATAISKATVARVPVPGTADDEELEPSSDPTGTFFSGRRSDAERGHLAWLHTSLRAIANARRQGADGLHLGTPGGVRFAFDGALATVLGPRDDAWLERALADPRVAADIWPWVADAMDARYHLNRALVMLWNDVRWRPPVGERETATLDDVLATLRFAYPLEPGLPWPWAEWREAFVLRGQTDPATFQMIQRATAQAGLRPPEPPPGSVLLGTANGSGPATAAAPPAAGRSNGSTGLVGYRRRPVTIVHEGWAVDLPGSFGEERTVEEWSGRDAGREVTLAATETAIGGQPMSADAFLREFAAGLGPSAIEHESGPVRGRARLSSDPSTGVEVATVEGYSAVRGSGAVIRIVIEDPEDWKWALDTWRTLRPA
jgi:hypothetical protein